MLRGESVSAFLGVRGVSEGRKKMFSRLPHSANPSIDYNSPLSPLVKIDGCESDSFSGRLEIWGLKVALRREMYVFVYFVVLTSTAIYSPPVICAVTVPPPQPHTPPLSPLSRLASPPLQRRHSTTPVNHHQDPPDYPIVTTLTPPAHHHHHTYHARFHA